MQHLHHPLPEPPRRPWVLAVVSSGQGSGPFGEDARTAVALELAAALAAHDRHADVVYLGVDATDLTAAAQLTAFSPTVADVRTRTDGAVDPAAVAAVVHRGSFNDGAPFSALLAEPVGAVPAARYAAVLDALGACATDIVVDIGADSLTVSPAHALLLPRADVVLVVTGAVGAQAHATAGFTRHLEALTPGRGALVLTDPVGGDAAAPDGGADVVTATAWPVAGEVPTDTAGWRAAHDELRLVTADDAPDVQAALLRILRRARVLSRLAAGAAGPGPA